MLGDVRPDLYLQPTVPSFEYPRGDLAPQVHFVVPLLPPVPADFTLPAWWDEMLDDPRPVVLVTQGTVATDPQDLLLPALDALRDEPVQVVAVTGGPDPADLPTPPNARVERFVPFAALMPHVAAEMSRSGGPEHAVDLLERLAATGEPVLGAAPAATVRAA
jgi:UDP:flavonoid glycosyltransferase YjiC (YdhE family)